MTLYCLMTTPPPQSCRAHGGSRSPDTTNGQCADRPPCPPLGKERKAGYQLRSTETAPAASWRSRCIAFESAYRRRALDGRAGIQTSLLRAFATAAIFLSFASRHACGQSEPWHLPGWQCRAVVEIPQPLTEPGVDTAAVKVLACGRAKPDGSDYRVRDAAGKPVPFQIAFHDAARYTLLAFRVTDPRAKYFVYFGNAAAARAPEQVAADPEPGTGPPGGDWVPHQGLVLTTLERPEGPNPENFDEMKKLLAGSRRALGARYQRRISDGYNSFGSSDDYISMYRGWIRIPAAGRYEFCTASNEASFSFLDGRELVHWPGRHTEERGMHGEKNAAVQLTAGLHYVEYYHEEVSLGQMAFLGWRPPGAAAFDAIPESIFTAPHQAAVTRYESPTGALPVFEPVIASSVWPAPHIRSDGQYTLCRFAAQPAGGSFQWDFGDGQQATGPEVEHLYLSVGTTKVTLTAADSPARPATWPLEVFEIEHVTAEFPEGRLADYVAAAQSYDRAKLDAASLRELAFLMSEAGDGAEAIAIAREVLERFPETAAPDTARLRRLIAENALRSGTSGLDEAIANYEASITAETPAPEKLDVLARLIRLVGIDRDAPEKAAALLERVDETLRQERRTAALLAAYRRALIASGDVLLWHGKRDGARDLYRRAEALSETIVPSQVRAARVGALPNAIRELIASGNLSAALQVVQRWEDDFPTEKLAGETLFWRGKLLALRDQRGEAVQYLARAVALAPGADFETEARWLLAESLEKLGKTDEARRELAKLIATGIQDAYTARAREQLDASDPKR